MDQVKVLSFDEILASKDYIEKEVPIPEWGGCVKIRSLSMGARLAINDLAVVGNNGSTKVDNAKFAAGTLVYGLLSPKIDMSQAEKLLDKSAEAVQKITNEIWSISGLGEQEAKNA